MQHGCNVGSLQSGSSYFHPSKKISLYLHALLVISRRTLSRNTQLGVLCQAALVVSYVPSGYTFPYKVRWGGRIKIVGGGIISPVHAYVHGRGYEVTWTTCTSSEPPPPQAKYLTKQR